MLGPHLQQLAHARHDVRLRDGLPRADRQRVVAVGLVAQVLLDEQVARDLAHRRQHPLVAHPAGGDHVADHPLTLDGEVAHSEGTAAPAGKASAESLPQREEKFSSPG